MPFTDLYWISPFSDTWDKTDNWSFSSGGASAGTVPDSTSNVLFDGNGQSSCFIDTTVNIGALKLSADYSYSLIQQNFPIYIQSDASFVGGFFVGHLQDMSVGGSMYIESNFTATDETTFVGRDFIYRDFIEGGLETVYTEEITLDAGDISNKYVVLSNDPYDNSNVALNIIHGVPQHYGLDYYIDGAYLKWDGKNLDGDLIVNDMLRVTYVAKWAGYFDHHHGKFDIAVCDNTFSGGGIRLWNLEISGDITGNHMMLDSSSYIENETSLTNLFFKADDATMHLQGDLTCTSTFGQRSEGLKSELIMDGSRGQIFYYTGGVIPNLSIDRSTGDEVRCWGSGPMTIEGNLNVYDGTFNTNGLSLEIGDV